MHKTGVTRGAAASGHAAWARRAAAHPQVVAALGLLADPGVYGRAICQWRSQHLLRGAPARGCDLGDGG